MNPQEKPARSRRQDDPAHAIAERVHSINGKDAAAAFHAALGRRRRP
jgi:hypothetical protein